MTNEEIISDFLRTDYTDENLSALLAHAEDGKLAYHSCCCLLGIPSADHALQGEANGAFMGAHMLELRETPRGFAVDQAYCYLSEGLGDANRRAKLIPLIHAEMQRRESLREVETLEMVTV